jgi:hypothetical protein
VFQKSPAQTAFWTFLESSRPIAGLVIHTDLFPAIGGYILLRYFKPNIFDGLLSFNPNIFGGTPTFQKFYFRRRRKFSFFFIGPNRADL